MELKRTSFPEIEKKVEHKNIIKGAKGFQPGTPRPPRLTERWESNSPQAFYNWLDDVKPRILTRSGRYEIFQPTETQRKQIEAVFMTNGNGDLRHSLCLEVQPRRHGKSTVWLLCILFFFTARKNQNIALLGNTDTHSHKTQFLPLIRIIRNTPELKKRIPERMIYNDSIRDDLHGNYISKVGVSMSTSFGERITTLLVSDLHACPDLAPFNALQAALLDSEGTILIDSNSDAIDGPVHALEKEAKEDDSIYANHIEYASFEEYCQKAPAWIDRKKAERLKRTTLEVDFSRDILGKRSSAVNALFPPEIIEKCKDSYRVPVIDINAITKGRAYKIGGGLDRARNLIAGPNGDHSVWTVILKVANPDGFEPLYYILNQTKFFINSSREIKKQILEDHQRYSLDNVILENYEVVDLQSWMAEQKIPCELVSATENMQNASFPELHRIARESRLHIPDNCIDLRNEMSTFVYIQRKVAGIYSFGHSSQKFKDDHVYSLNHAVFSLRHEVMDVFSLNHIDCTLPDAQRRSVCFLMGGNHILHCSEECRAFHEVREMFREYKSFHALDSDLDIIHFYKAYVRAEGLIQYQGV